jgi:hypothetical protein
MCRAITLLSVAVTFALSMLGAAKPAPTKEPPPKATEVQEFKEQNIKFTTPGSWQKQGQGCHGSFSVLTIPSKPFSYTVRPGHKPPPMPAANYSSCFMAATDSANDGKTLDEAIEKFQKEMSDALKGQITFTPTTDVTVAGEPARSYTASYKMKVGDGDPDVPRKEAAVFVARGKRVYEFFMQASTPNFERDKARLAAVLKSVNWLDAAAAEPAKQANATR